MKSNSLPGLLVEASLERMFVADKHGHTFFFPWGTEKNGYVLNDPAVRPNFSKFFLVSATVYFFAFIFSVALSNGEAVIVAIIIWTALWFLVYRLYILKIVKSLPAAQRSYKEIILEKITPDETEIDDKDLLRPSPGYPLHVNYQPGRVKSDALLNLERFYFHISDGLKAGLLFLFGFIPIVFVPPANTKANSGRLEENLLLLVTFFCWGLSGFILTTKVDWTESGGWRSRKYGYMVMMIACWAVALFIICEIFIGWLIPLFLVK
jgi:hypothetical protein